MIDEYAADHLCCYGKEMSPPLPVGVLLTAKPQINFVHQCSALQSLGSRFSTEVVACQPPQVFIDERHQSVQSALVPIAPAQQEFGYFAVLQSPNPLPSMLHQQCHSWNTMQSPDLLSGRTDSFFVFPTISSLHFFRYLK